MTTTPTQIANVDVRFSLARPNITEAEIEAVVAVLRTPQLALGPRLLEFEEIFATACQTRYAVAVSSGTAALHLLIQAMGITDGDEVITTPFSFVASTNCILYERAKPVFVDIDPHTWNINTALIESAVGPRTKAILPVDVFGQVADMDEINAVADHRKLRVIEDSCEALGSSYKGRAAGSLGHAGVFGFYPNKQITTGEGGMIVTDDEALATLCASLRNQGRDPSAGWLEHPRLGFNYRLSEINCALGIVQMNRLPDLVEQRSRVAGWYRESLSDERRVRLQRISADVQMSWFVMVICLSDDYDDKDRDRVLDGLRKRGIGCSNYFVPIHLQKYMVDLFGYRRGDFPVCEHISDRTIALPFHADLSKADVVEICRELRSLL